jgi:hypothetical protein
MASSLDGLGPHVPLSTQIMVETLPRLGDVLIVQISRISYDNGKRATGFQARKSSAATKEDHHHAENRLRDPAHGSGFSCRLRRAGAPCAVQQVSATGWPAPLNSSRSVPLRGRRIAVPLSCVQPAGRNRYCSPDWKMSFSPS